LDLTVAEDGQSPGTDDHLAGIPGFALLGGRRNAR
jgi:hypothetical protein